MKPTAIDLAIAEHHLQFPELILEIEPWETLKFCSECGGEIDPAHPCLFYTINGFNIQVSDPNRGNPNREGGRVFDKYVACPHCGIQNKAVNWKKPIEYKDASGEKKTGLRPIESIYSSEPIETDTIFRRKVWVSKRKPKTFLGVATGWTGEDRYFYEYRENKK